MTSVITEPIQEGLINLATACDQLSSAIKRQQQKGPTSVGIAKEVDVQEPIDEIQSEASKVSENSDLLGSEVEADKTATEEQDEDPNQNDGKRAANIVRNLTIKPVADSAATQAAAVPILPPPGDPRELQPPGAGNGGTRKPRMHKRKKTQRKRSKTIKKKNKAGKRK